MSMPLPVDGFDWVDDSELENCLAESLQVEEDSPEGYFLQVGIEIPEDMHDYLNELPPFMMKRCVPESELSSAYQKPLKENLEAGPSMEKTTKLIADLYNKPSYIIHHRLLQLFMKLKCPKSGSQLRITKVHAAVKFNQQAWMKIYIDTNTEMRNRATSDFEKDFWKLMNNSAFGKMIEQVRKRQNVNLVFREDQAINLLKKPTVQQIIDIDENFSIYLMKKLNVQLNKPLYVGVSILDLSKYVMYDMHYNGIKSCYGDRARLMYMDTDSLIYHLQTEDMYEDNLRNPFWFDNSKYDPNNPLFGRFFNNRNKDVLGKFKDEYANGIITHFVAPRPKMYALRSLKIAKGNKRTASGKFKMEEMESKRAKGIGRVTVQKNTRMEEYWDSIRKGEQSFKTMKVIRSRRHLLFTELLRKKAISALCNKRWALSSIYSLAHGHHEIERYEREFREHGYYDFRTVEIDTPCIKYLDCKL